MHWEKEEEVCMRRKSRLCMGGGRGGSAHGEDEVDGVQGEKEECVRGGRGCFHGEEGVHGKEEEKSAWGRNMMCMGRRKRMCWRKMSQSHTHLSKERETSSFFMHTCK